MLKRNILKVAAASTKHAGVKEVLFKTESMALSQHVQSSGFMDYSSHDAPPRFDLLFAFYPG
jgi:hypothetical protein